MPYLNFSPWESRRAQYRLLLLIVILFITIVSGWLFSRLLLLAEANQLNHQQQRNQHLINSNIKYQNTALTAKQLVQQIDDFNAHVKQLSDIKKQSTIMPALLNFVAVSISNNITLTELSLQGDTLSLKGNADDNLSINAFITTMGNFRLLDRGRMVNLQADNIPDSERKRVFHMTFNLAPDKDF